jgi:hypothetical protein
MNGDGPGWKAVAWPDGWPSQGKGKHGGPAGEADPGPVGLGRGGPGRWTGGSRGGEACRPIRGTGARPSRAQAPAQPGRPDAAQLGGCCGPEYQGRRPSREEITQPSRGRSSTSPAGEIIRPSRGANFLCRPTLAYAGLGNWAPGRYWYNPAHAVVNLPF